MEREIKFRGKRIDNREWIYGYAIYNQWHNTYKIDTGLYGVSSATVDPSTIGQYTGLKDHNENDLYEGDVFTVGANKKVFECRFERGCFVAYLDGKQYGIIGELHEMYIKVIGNIHEHPELLKQQQ